MLGKSPSTNYEGKFAVYDDPSPSIKKSNKFVLHFRIEKRNQNLHGWCFYEV
jgi:hypothetical protein